jgi:hypothetical protein
LVDVGTKVRHKEPHEIRVSVRGSDRQGRFFVMLVPLILLSLADVHTPAPAPDTAALQESRLELKKIAAPKS